jgi:hypothetical protein
MGGVEVLVRNEDAARAEELLGTAHESEVPLADDGAE